MHRLRRMRAGVPRHRDFPGRRHAAAVEVLHRQEPGRVPEREPARQATAQGIVTRAPGSSPRGSRFRSGEAPSGSRPANGWSRSEEHTSELQSRLHLVCRLLLEKKKKEEPMYAPPTSAQLITLTHLQLAKQQHLERPSDLAIPQP